MSYNAPFLSLLAQAGIKMESKSKLGPQEQPMRDIQYKGHTITLRVNPGVQGSRAHRVVAICDCGKLLSAGRLDQHFKAKIHQPRS